MVAEKIKVYLSQDVECERHGDFPRAAFLELSEPYRRVHACLECLGEAIRREELDMEMLMSGSAGDLCCGEEEVGFGC